MTALCVLAIAASLVSPGAPQVRTRSSADPDLNEIASYTLTMDVVNKVDRVNRSMLATLKTDPRFAEAAKLETELEALRKKDETTEAEDKRKEQIEARLEALTTRQEKLFNLNDAKTLADMTARIQAFTPMVSALQKEGLSARDYAKFMLTLIQTGFAAGLQKAGMLKETPEGVNPANIKFVLEHEEDLKKLQQGMSDK
jgi:hypothetical protein